MGGRKGCEMKATETKFLDFLKGPKQFIIPIYQRTYSWTLKQCEQLWRDIVRAAMDETVSGHFVGSIVYIQKGLYRIAAIPQLLVIDGQQRLTTVSLLLSALGQALQQESDQAEITLKKLTNYFLANAEEEGDLRYKLLLTQSDRQTLTRLVDGKAVPEDHSKRVAENYAFFRIKIAESDLDLATLYKGIGKLIVVDISLDREHDNPQLIFESLNSTGLELSQADLIRNYVLMGLEPKQQEALYTDHWFPMEQSFGQVEYAAQFDRFMRDYLTIRLGRIPNIREVYAEFKGYVATTGKDDAALVQTVADIYRFSRHFVRIALEREDDKELRHALQDINTLKVDVAYPFLLEVYDDYAAGKISRDDLLRILRTVESYVFRRAVSGIPTNSLNKTFATLSKSIDKDRYLESFTAALLLKDSYRRFPADEEFMRELAVKDVYNFRNRNYLLRRLENHDRKERVSVEEYTIEHILPQNENLSVSWKADLGDKWKDVHARYLHTIGNLTLTGYNPEYGDRPFKEKRDMHGGFADSPIRLNEGLGKLEAWNEAEIANRANRLVNLATKVWPLPMLPSETLEKYRKNKAKDEGEHVYTLEDHPKLKGDMLTLFELFRDRVLALGPDVTQHVLKLYIAFKTDTNFVDVIVRKRKLRLTLNMDFNEIDDPKGLCGDVTGKGMWGNGNVMVKLHSADELDDVLALIKQSYTKHSVRA
jgi:uncharacterized protein with ParB-like and HNH nuclease domain/predicted transport protein